ncbi:low molecular weight phosphatase family protein [Sinomonas notoginsengisoli]|uniref:arsenate reductase/protein-tyrosine-phosphatase family protein n=1 Tax=Sinomonas notoginsengisoli TaxID=1457311 RepID=UPI001F2DD010|nr:low molecular weight phosphatase family protein [Sinomonas notoginsengisoli]
MSRFRIVVVCTGNVCRSPLAAALLRDALEEISPGSFSVDSAGTHALVGQPAQPGSAEIARELGTSLDRFSAQQLTEAMVTGADLILTLSTEHKGRVLSLAPGALKRTFTLREFARGLADLGAGIVEPATGPSDHVAQAWRHLVARVWERQAQSFRRRAEEDDVTDPYRLGPDAYARMREEMVPALEVVFGSADRMMRR